MAASLAALLASISTKKIDVQLLPSSGGVFEVMVDGTLIYSKKATGEHADLETLAAEIAAL